MSGPSWTRVEALYHAALARDAAERETFLDQACEGDGELRREVQSLLGYEKEAAGLMEQPLAGAATQRLAVVRGTRLGPYEVVELVGAGGMGEVYRARDTRLGRNVAIKVLPAQASQDAAALARFDREARAVAALSHPHIAALFDIGATDGTHYLVMELLEGETLAARLRRGALPEKEALRIGSEIAEALGAAHAHGIVHRDVKPANVMLTRAGVKLLDFGLARLQQSAVSPGESANTAGLSEDVIAGTLPYMAPEQLEGKEADARTDIWALGCVLFEMLAGRRAFEGDSQAVLIAAIEKDETPPLPSATASNALERLVRQCLQKDPEERWQSVRDLALRLCEVAESTSDDPRPNAGGRRSQRGKSRWLVPVTAATASLLIGFLGGRSCLRSPQLANATGVVRSQIDLTTDRQLFDKRYGNTLALSPDGTLLVWAARTNSQSLDFALYQRRLDTGDVTRVPGGELGLQPFFSSDGRWIGFFQAGAGFFQADGGFRLRKIRVAGGLPVDLATLSDLPMGATWGQDDRIYLGSGNRGLREVPAEGGSPREITTVDRDREAAHRLPSVLPGGHELLVTVPANRYGLKIRIEVLSLATWKRKVVVEDGADGRYLPSGHLVFVRQGVLMAAPFDLARLELAGAPVPVLDSVSQTLNSAGGSGAGHFTVSATGLLAYASGGMHPDTPVELLLVDETGRTEPLPGFDRPLVSPQLSFSPDGRFMAFNEQARTGLLWLFDVERHTCRALSERGIAGSPRWSPDGRRLAVGWSEAGPMQLWIVPADRGAWKRLTAEDQAAWSPSWSPDGRFLAFTRVGSSHDIFIYRFEDGRTLPFLASPTNEEWCPAFSPDGRWLAYTSNEGGREEVYVTSFPGREKTLTVSRQGGMDPAWSRDGKRIYYCAPRSGDMWSMAAVTVRQDPELSLGRPELLFQLPDRFVVNATHSYELHPDGRHFVIGRYVKTEPPPPIIQLELVHNWFAELERLCPTRR